MDNDAKNALSAYAYTIHNEDVQNAYTLIQSIEVKDGIIICKSINALTSKQTIIKWKENERCPCPCSHDLDFQCEHKLKDDGRFISDKFGSRWLQNHVYDKMHYVPTFQDTQEECSINDIDNNNDVGNEFDTTLASKTMVV